MMAIDKIDFLEPSPDGEAPLRAAALRRHPQDHVAIAKINLQPGAVLILENNDPGKVLPRRGVACCGVSNWGKSCW